MKALLEIVTIAQPGQGSGRPASVTVNTDIIGFNSRDEFEETKERITAYESIGGVAIYRTLSEL